MIVEILSLIIGGGSLVTLLIFLIKRHDERKDELGKINKQLYTLEKDGVRTQLLLLMEHYTDEDEHELLTCAEHYFSEEHLNANWYMTAKFKRFLDAKKIPIPIWFKGD